MVARLEEVDPVVAHQVDNAVLVSETPGPGAWHAILQWLRTPDAPKRIVHDSLDEVEGTQRHATVCFDPVAEILAKLGMEDGFAGSSTRPGQSSAPDAKRRGSV